MQGFACTSRSWSNVTPSWWICGKTTLVTVVLESPKSHGNSQQNDEPIYRYLGSTFRSMAEKNVCFCIPKPLQSKHQLASEDPTYQQLRQRQSSFLLGKLGAQPLRFTDAGRWQTRQPQRVRNMSLHQESSCSCEAMLLVVLHRDPALSPFSIILQQIKAVRWLSG